MKKLIPLLLGALVGAVLGVGGFYGAQKLNLVPDGSTSTTTDSAPDGTVDVQNKATNAQDVTADGSTANTSPNTQNTATAASAPNAAANTQNATTESGTTNTAANTANTATAESTQNTPSNTQNSTTASGTPNTTANTPNTATAGSTPNTATNTQNSTTASGTPNTAASTADTVANPQNGTTNSGNAQSTAPKTQSATTAGSTANTAANNQSRSASSNKPNIDPNVKIDGFNGGLLQTITVAQADKFGADTWIKVRGNIVEKIGDEEYLFRDRTGNIKVGIENKYWEGRAINPNDIIDITGELIKNWSSSEINAKNIEIITPQK